MENEFQLLRRGGLVCYAAHCTVLQYYTKHHQQATNVDTMPLQERRVWLNLLQRLQDITAKMCLAQVGAIQLPSTTINCQFDNSKPNVCQTFFFVPLFNIHNTCVPFQIISIYMDTDLVNILLEKQMAGECLKNSKKIPKLTN